MIIVAPDINEKSANYKQIKVKRISREERLIFHH